MDLKKVATGTVFNVQKLYSIHSKNCKLNCISMPRRDEDRLHFNPKENVFQRPCAPQHFRVLLAPGGESVDRSGWILLFQTFAKKFTDIIIIQSAASGDSRHRAWPELGNKMGCIIANSVQGVSWKSSCRHGVWPSALGPWQQIHGPILLPSPGQARWRESPLAAPWINN